MQSLLSYSDLIKMYSEQNLDQLNFNSKVLIVSDFETTQFSKALQAYLISKHLKIEVHNSKYNTVFQTLLDKNLTKEFNYVLLMFSPQHFKQAFYTSGFTAKEKLDEISSILHHVQKQGKTILLTTMPLVNEQVWGNRSRNVELAVNYQIELFNKLILDLAENNKEINIIDLAFTASQIGLNNWYSPGLWYQAKYVCHPRYYPNICQAIARNLEATSGRVFKCIVLDLDNTLWGGVIGDDGINGIKLGPEGEGAIYSDIQRYFLQLKKAGYLLALASKNYEDIALEAINNHPNMVLKSEDFVCYKINWNNKAENIQAISQELNLGLNSFLFIDDNPMERELVKTSLPEVTVPNLPEDPTEYINYINQLFLFENISFTKEDQLRNNLYKTEIKRNSVKSSFSNLDEFLESLQMSALIYPVNPTNIDRAEQLIQRSNQFNLRTQRLNCAELSKRTKDSNFINFCVKLEDKFGDLGIIAVVSCAVNHEEIFIDEFVMSCRVLQRGVEELIFNYLIQKSIERNIKLIRGGYIKSEKNILVKDLYHKFNFKKLNTKDQETNWILDTTKSEKFKHYIKTEVKDE